jgi:hypothetical protein
MTKLGIKVVLIQIKIGCEENYAQFLSIKEENIIYVSFAN